MFSASEGYSKPCTSNSMSGAMVICNAIANIQQISPEIIMHDPRTLVALSKPCACWKEMFVMETSEEEWPGAMTALFASGSGSEARQKSVE